MTTLKPGHLHKHLRKILLGVAPIALSLFLFGSTQALATVDNTVTAKGTAPNGVVDAVVATDSATVDVQDAAPAVEVVRSWAFVPGPTGDVNNNGLVDAGDQIVYSYAVHNAGNVTLKDVTAADVHDGTGSPLTMVVPTSVTTDNSTPNTGTANDSTDLASNNDGDWDVLGPNDYITFVSQPYTVTPGDLTASTSSDGDIDGTVTATGHYDPGSAPTSVSGTGVAAVPLNIVSDLQISKVASSDINVPAGTVITYTYLVKNNGTVPISSITLHDTHKGVLDALTPTFVEFTINANNTSTNASNTITVLQPGDEAKFTANYTVTQADVDTLQ